jgi:hypothetical protein
MKIADPLDKHLGQHHLHEGLSNGSLTVRGLAYLLSESDHRKTAVQKGANSIPCTLEAIFGTLQWGLGQGDCIKVGKMG